MSTTTLSYFPRTLDGRGHWWENILANGAQAFGSLNWSSGQSQPILYDAAWAVYAYLTVRHAFDGFEKAVTAYADTVIGEAGGAVPTPPIVPIFPVAPTVPYAGPGIEKRREKWVQAAKDNPAYTPVIGALLGIETPDDSFNKATYQAQLYDVSSPNPQTVGGKFRKAGGRLDSINLYGRRHTTGVPWALLGRFSATPFSCHVALSGPNAEEWEFEARAVRRDVEFGLPSATVIQLIRA